MCGIAGVLDLRGRAVAPELLRSMVTTLHHRGPDDSGLHAEGPVGLAHARLSILDLAGGAQPMTSQDGTLALSFNGEIFNYLELREELARRGRRFLTRSDTEVILHLYDEYGEDCVHHMNGQWAFALWDARRQRLFLSRDRIGVRPLFHTRASGQFLFASEVKALFAHPAVPRELDLRGLGEVFTFWCTLAPRTVFRGVEELPPGHSLVVEADGQAQLRRYWQLDFSPAVPAEQPEALSDRLRELLLDATRLRLRADVPVGAYLSGGLDSSVIAALIKKYTDTPLETFSVTFEDPEFDESGFQGDVIRFLETDHRSVRCGFDDIGRVFPEVVWHMETPVVRTAPAPLYLLSGLVRECGYKVVLTGEGSDEMLGGYDIFKEAKIRRFWAAQPESKLRPLLLRRLYPYLKNIQAQPDAYRKAFFHVRPEEVSSPFFSHLPRWELTARCKAFFADGVQAELAGHDPVAELAARLPAEYARWDGFAQAQYLEATIVLPGYILSSQGDRVAMGHSIEGRFPFLDYRVMEFAAALPPHLKMKVLDEKHLLKRCAADLVPRSVRERPKQPYRAPEAASFFRPGEERSRHAYVEELLSPERLQRAGVFKPEAVTKLVAKVQRGQAIGIKDNMALVGILSTQILVDRFIEHFER